MKTFIVVYFAVILANISTLAVYEYYQQHKEKKQAAMETIEIINAEATEAKLDQDAVISTTEENRLQQQHKSAEKLCNYWIREYKKDPTGLNEALKNKACLRAKKLQPAMPSEE